ncbi:MAG: ACP S-malonyltransferase [Flavobacteriales bacterium]|nr:Malonyl CoA-acyl carrier protein transacylase [Flavobacteriales bacterium]MCC6577999.1 ACP S-malonyltransferase [Flavobacteriales bacterium]NUQ15601.1 ACP S-malonyltransferase [Flavobacteriales bacterium]
MTAYVFPGQGSQFPGMGKDLYDADSNARIWFEHASDLLGFKLTDVMFNGSEADLKRTNVTQPAIFLHSVVKAKVLGDAFRPAMVAGHSLGEFSALVAAGAMEFADGMKLVAARANAMQKACEQQPGTMAAILGLDDAKVEAVCAEVSAGAGKGVVVAANYNCPGQLVISGTVEAVNAACEALKAAGAKRALVLPVGGAFHSPLMEPARVELETAIAYTPIVNPRCPVYQNVDGRPHTDPARIKANLIAQLTAPVRWTQTMQHILADGCTQVVETGPGNVLQGLFKKVDRDVPTSAA